MKTKRSAFNLIELTLAIAVVGIGIASIMALFVPAIDSTKNSIADNYAGDIVNSFTSYLEALARKGTNWNTFFVSPGALVYDPDDQNKLPDPESSSLGENEKKILNPAEWDENNTDMQTGIPGLYKLGSSTDYYLYGVKAGNMFSGHIRVWAEEITDFYVPGSSSTGNVGLSKAARVYIELSWPATVKDENRNRRLYVTELYNY